MVLKGCLHFLDNTVVLGPHRFWIPECFQSSVHSKMASSTTFYLWVWKMTFFIVENPGILSTPGWLCMYLYIYMCV